MPGKEIDPLQSIDLQLAEETEVRQSQILDHSSPLSRRLPRSGARQPPTYPLQCGPCTAPADNFMAVIPRPATSVNRDHLPPSIATTPLIVTPSPPSGPVSCRLSFLQMSMRDWLGYQYPVGRAVMVSAHQARTPQGMNGLEQEMLDGHCEAVVSGGLGAFLHLARMIQVGARYPAPRWRAVRRGSPAVWGTHCARATHAVGGGWSGNASARHTHRTPD